MPRLNKLLMIAVFCILNAGCTQMVTLAYKPEATGAALNTRIDIEKLSMQAAVEIEVGVFDAYGYQVANFTALGKSPIMDMTRFSTGVAGYFIPFFGTVMGRNTVSITSRQALNKAIADFHDQIVEQTESGVLARHWLPKRENREYEIGNHQFPAERVAIAAGCRIGADKVRLVYQNYFAESFVASCWGKPSLAIDCEFGRCASQTGLHLRIRCNFICVWAFVLTNQVHSPRKATPKRVFL